MCSAPWFSAAIGALTAQHGDRLCGPTPELNELLRLLGEAERVYKGLPTPAADAKDGTPSAKE